jgi:DNA-binding LacI/PurR family transcriptional regulator
LPLLIHKITLSESIQMLAWRYMSVKPKHIKTTSKRRVTLSDIAERLGVARSTVSNAYNRPDQLSDALREKILETAARLGYTGPDPAARNLRKGMTQSVGLLYPSPLSYAFTDPVAALFIQGIAIEIERDGYTLLLVGGPSGNSAESSAIPAMTANVDGFIVHCFADGDPLLKAALARNLPTVMVDNLTIKNFPYVTVADTEGAAAAAEHLISLGHQRLGVIALELTPEAVGGIVDRSRQETASYRPTRARLEGYRSATQQAGISWDEHVTVVETRDNTYEEGRAAAAVLLKLTPRPTAILAMSDRLALGALAEAQAQKLNVPQDLSVVGFDDIADAARSQPPLTTVYQSHVDKGRQAGKLLLAQLRGKPTKSVTLATRLVIRDSSARAPGSG